MPSRINFVAMHLAVDVLPLYICDQNLCVFEKSFSLYSFLTLARKQSHMIFSTERNFSYQNN